MEKKLQNYVKKVDFGLTYMRFAVVTETSKNDRNTIDTSKVRQKINEQLLNVSASFSQSSYQNLKETLWEWQPASLQLQKVLHSLSFHCPKQYSKAKFIALT